jgi:hypothetical protein
VPGRGGAGVLAILLAILLAMLLGIAFDRD